MNPSIYQVGDQVELITVPLGRGKRLRVGLVGEVVVINQEFGWVSVVFSRIPPYPFRLRPVHLQLVAPVPAKATA